MIFSLVNFVYMLAAKPMEEGNKIELFNEFCILLCAYVMNIFLAKAAPAPFMFNVGWVFMGISVFNIVVNFAAMFVGLVHENGVKVKNNLKNKEVQKIIDRRLANLLIINEFKPQNLGYVQKELELQSGIKVLKAWWPHHKWLKKNKMNCRHFKQEKEFGEVMEKLTINKRLKDVHLSRQAIELAR